MWQLLTAIRTVEACGCWVAAVLCSLGGKKLLAAASAGWGWLAGAGDSLVGGRGGSWEGFQLSGLPWSWGVSVPGS